MDILAVDFCLKLTRQNAGNSICRVLVFKIFWGSMRPDPPRGSVATPLADAFGVQFLDTVRFYARSAPVPRCQEGINTKLHLDLRASINLQINYFLSWLYIQDFCMFCISKYREGINTKLHLDLRASIDLQIDHFLSWLYTGFPYVLYFQVGRYCKGINTRLYLHYKTKCTS